MDPESKALIEALLAQDAAEDEREERIRQDEEGGEVYIEEQSSPIQVPKTSKRGTRKPGGRSKRPSPSTTSKAASHGQRWLPEEDDQLIQGIVGHSYPGDTSP